MAALSALNYNILRAGLKIMQSNENSGGSCESTNGNCSSGSSGNNAMRRITSITKTFNKITVQNVLNESTSNALNISNNNNNSTDTNENNMSHGSGGFNNANAIVKKIKDFGMIGAVNAVNNLNSNYNSTNSSSGSSTKGIRSNLSGSSKRITVPRKRPSNETKSNKNSSSSTKPLTTTTKIVPATKTPTESIEAPPPTAPCPTSSSTPTTKKSKLNPNKTTATPKSHKKKSCENADQKKLIGSDSPSTKPLVGTSGRRGVPAPQAVARRNARERNRVKQVNNGFAALRERIPEEVAESFESQSNNRNSNSKKLSKVETLRMAVEYIRGLERLLGFDFPINGDKSTGHDGFALIKNELGALSSEMDDQFDDSMSNYELDEDFMASREHSMNEKNPTSAQMIDSMEQSIENNALDLLPNLTTLNGLQYIRIPGTNTYQLLTVDLFTCGSHSPTRPGNIGDNHFMGLIDSNCQSPRSSPSSAASAADLHSSPTTAATSIMQTTAAPALHQNVTTIGDHVKLTGPTSSTSSSLSLLQSPVPQTSPSTATHSRLQQGSGLATPTLSPVGNELLLQTCADDVALANIINNERLSAVAERQFVPCAADQQQQLMLPSNLMKRELNETDYGTTSTQFPNASPSIILPSIMQHLHHHSQQQRQQPLLLAQTTTLSTSPPLDAANSSRGIIISSTPNTPASLPAYFEHDQNRSFYESSLPFKKEFSDALMDASQTPTAALSDESMIDAIDWWEAHTPKSDGASSVIV